MFCCYMWGGGGGKRVKDTAHNQEKHFIKAVHVKSSLESKWLILKLRISNRIENKIHIFLSMQNKSKVTSLVLNTQIYQVSHNFHVTHVFGPILMLTRIIERWNKCLAHSAWQDQTKHVSNNYSAFCFKSTLKMHLQPFPEFKKIVFHAWLHTPLHKKTCAPSRILSVSVWLPFD